MTWVMASIILDKRIFLYGTSFFGWIGMGASMLLLGCALSPVERIEQDVRDYGFTRQVVFGDGFSHVIYRNNGSSRSGPLHVYLEGDGSPWLQGRFIATDPTPRNPVMLHLMALDSTPSVYLGRPCYHGLMDQASCVPQYWTHGRYSMRVVLSMAAVLRRAFASGQYTGLMFFGHSGGGTLAMLLAERFPQTQVVVTLAGNLDPDAWTQYHDYSPLRSSLNPSRRTSLDPAIYQLHLVGGRDENIPPRLSHAAVARQKKAEIRIINNFNHGCCWHKLWSTVLQMLTDR